MKKWLSFLLVISVCITLIAPAGVYAAPSTTINDTLGQTPTQNNIVKKNIYEKNLNDVCYFSDDEHFYAIGDAGTLLKSLNGTNWSQVTDTDIASSSTVDFVAMDCTDSHIAIIGNDAASQNTNYVYVKENNNQFIQTNLSTVSGANGTNIRVNDIVMYNNNIIIVTDNGYIYRSTDNGGTWGHISITGSGNYQGAKSITRKQSQYMIFNNSSPSDSSQYYFYTTDPSSNTWTQGQFTSKFPGTITDTFFGADNKWHAISNNNGTTGYITSFIDGGIPTSPSAGYMPLGGFSANRGTSTVKIIVGYKGNDMIIRSSDDQYQNQNQDQLHTYNSGGGQLRYANLGPGKLHAVTGANISGTWTYVAVGTSGTILKSTNGYLFTPVAQTADTTKTISHYAIHPNTSLYFVNNSVAITNDNKVYFSENGADFIEWNNVILKGEIIALEFPNTNNAKVFVGTVDRSTNTSYIYSIEYGVATETAYPDFIANGYSKTPSGIALLGANASGKGKIVTSITATFDGTLNRASLPEIHLATQIGTEHFTIVGTNLYFAEWNNPSFGQTYNIFPYNSHGLENISYKKHASSGTEHLFMDAVGKVMLLSSISFSQAQIRKTVVYTGESMGLTNFQLKELISVNDVFFTLSQSGKLSQSFDGIMWSDVSALNNQSVADIDKKENNLIVTLANGTVKTFNIPYSPKVEDTYTHYPVITLSRPNGTNYDNELNRYIMQFNATSDPNYNDTRRTFNWYLEDQGQLTEITASAGEDHFDIATLAGGTHNIVAKVTHTDTTKLDRTTTERLYGPFTYNITERVFGLSASFSDTTFEVSDGYTANDVQPITITLTNTGNMDLNDITISTANTTLTASSFSASVDASDDETIDLILTTGLAIGTYTNDITIASTSNKFTPITETITINVLAPPVYSLDVTADSPSSTRVGYSANDVKFSITVTNDGDQDVTGIQIALNDTTKFSMASYSSTLQVGSTFNTEVYLNTGLRAGNYPVTVTLTADNGISHTITKTFTVTGSSYSPPSDPYTPSPTPTPEPTAPNGLQATITEANGTTVNNLIQNGVQVVGTPVQVTLNNNAGANIDRSEQYVEIEMNANSPYTTVVFIDENGNMHHVPTLTVDGNTVVASVTQSGVYALVNLNNTFTDINGHWAESTISNLANRGILNGTGDNNYSPSQEITRAEFTTMLVRALGLSYSAKHVAYNDIANDAWYSEAIQIATSYGLITGYRDGSFGPNDKITREQAMVIIARAAALNSLTAPSTQVIEQYTDHSLLANYAREAANTNVTLGLINGVSETELAPKKNVSRAEIAVIIERLLQMAGLID